MRMRGYPGQSLHGERCGHALHTNTTTRIPGNGMRRVGTYAKNAKNNGRRRRDDEDVELYNINSGWNENAFAVAAEVLSEMHGWEVSVPSPRSGDAGEIVSGEDGVERMMDDSDDDDDDDSAMVWSIDGVDVDADAGTSEPQQYVTSENVLESLPRHVMKRLMKEQEEAIREEENLDSNTRRKVAARSKTHRKLRIISGSAASVRLISPQGDQTRPMMEKVRGAVFSMIGSLYGSTGGLPEETRWLDLFAGTGAVGIEAMSRGVGEGHFVELSEWVVNNCLSKNIENCSVESRSVIHTMKAEEYLKRAARFPGQAIFDFISVCPPYELVSYPELYDLLESSNLIGDETIVLVEYPLRVKEHILDTLGPLTKVRDRKYGRTWLALYCKQETS